MKSKSKRGQKVFVTHKSQKVIARSDVTGFYYPGICFCPHFKYFLAFLNTDKMLVSEMISYSGLNQI